MGDLPEQNKNKSLMIRPSSKKQGMYDWAICQSGIKCADQALYRSSNYQVQGIYFSFCKPCIG
jgi:hypothetical protein